MKTIRGIAAAPSVVTITGAMPVTRIVPARPMTNAPHQLVSFASPPPAYSSSSSGAPAAPGCSDMDLSSSSSGTARPKCHVPKTRSRVKLEQRAATNAHENVCPCDTPVGENVASAPIARWIRQPIYLLRQRARCRVPAAAGILMPSKTEEETRMTALDQVAMNGKAPFTAPATAEEARE